LEKFSLRVNDILTYKFVLSPIDKLILEKTVELTKINIDIFGDNKEIKGIETEIDELKTELSKIEERLDEPYRLYQKYIQDLANWTNRRNKIIGAPSLLNSIEYFKDQIKYLDEKLNEELQTELTIRNNLIKKLFDKKSEIIKQYKLSYKPITDFIEKYGHLMNEYQINLTVEFTFDGFVQKFFDHISQGAKGTYIGVEEGNKYLSELISQFNINDSQGLIDFLSSIRETLFFDKKSNEENISREIEKQLKKGYTTEDLYKFLYYCEYVKPIFKLNLGDKSISSLSPGERGALLLIFYLFLDKDDKPLIIDQPEENLDNQSVYKYLVHFIKEAKQRRQIIIVTHNPNLAVVCDAEQIIHMTIDKNANHTVSCEAGAIENPKINKVIVDILEGTKPAFKNRTNKYSSIFV
jgi:DNA repair exonuclease SbcCD ATPase subunit